MRLSTILTIIFTVVFSLPLSAISINSFQDSMLVLFKNNEVERGYLVLNEGLELAQQEDDLVSYLKLIKKAGSFWKKTSSPELGINIYKKGYEESLWRSPCTEKEWNGLAWLYVQLASVYDKKIGDYQSAQVIYNKANAIFEQKMLSPNRTNVAKFVWRSLGNIYTRSGDFFTAKTLINQFIQQMLLIEDNKRAAEGYNDLAILFEHWEKEDEAYQTYQKGLNLDNGDEISKSTLLLNLSKLLLLQDSLSRAFEYVYQAQTILKSVNKEDDPSMRTIYLLGVAEAKLADAFEKRKDYEQVISSLQKAIGFYQEYFGDTKRREFAKIHIQLGGIYFELNDYKTAIKHHQTSLQNVLYDYQPVDEFDLPSATSFYPENTILEGLESLADVYRAKYETQMDHFFLLKALECYDLIYEVEDHLRRSYMYENSKLINLEESQKRSEDAIQIAHQLFELTDKIDYLYQAFIFSERNRSSLLREALRSSQAMDQLGLSEEELTKEKDLNYQVNKALEERFHLQEEGVADSLIQAADQALLNAKKNQKIWIEALETKHSRYYQLKYSDDLPSLEEYQAMLSSDQLLIEYFVGKDQLYVFTINKNELALELLPLPDKLDQQVLSWRKNIENYQYSDADRTKLMAEYMNGGHQLYKSLLADILVQYKEAKELLIISSGILDLLPFEALLQNAVKPKTSLNHLPYLINNYTIGYCYSATLYHSLAQLPRMGEGMGAFAPDFSGNKDWSSLSCSNDLFEKIDDNWQKELHSNEKASSQRFRALASKYQLLHLATHAHANAENGDFSFILFHNEKGGYDSLYTKDLYLEKIVAELVILSACETALGTLYNSEGVISLARAFHYAGARSIVTTLWRVNEGANCHLMENFYKELGDNHNKAEALHNAKIQYLSQADGSAAHPVYWAGFQFSGNQRPMKKNTPFLWGLLGVMGLVVLGVGIKNKCC